jgi:hypothetical protein
MTRVMAILGLALVTFAVTLGVYVGQRLSKEAVSVLTGAACGMGAMVPAVLIGMLAMWRRRETQTATHAMSASSMPQGASPYPPVIVIAPPSQPNAASNAWQAMFQPGISAGSGDRQFSVIGEEEGVWKA